MGLFSELYTVRDAEALLMDTFDLRAQDKHRAPMHLIKHSSIQKKQIKIEQEYTKPQWSVTIYAFIMKNFGR